jgi:hypothetical protein
MVLDQPSNQLGPLCARRPKKGSWRISVIEQNLRDGVDCPAALSDTDPKIPVLEASEVFVIPPDLFPTGVTE